MAATARFIARPYSPATLKAAVQDALQAPVAG